MITNPTRSHTFLTLDALRGIAALTVVFGHSSEIFGGPQYFEHSYLAVDFFFALSGFVLSYAYQQRLDNGLSTTAFLKARIIRLYPLYIAGTLAEFIYTLLADHSAVPVISSHLLPLIPALFFVPIQYRPGRIDGLAFPYNAFAWTLFYELVANILHAAWLRRRSSRLLLIVACITGILLFRMTLRYGFANMGLFTRDLPFALLRVMFSYLIGMLLFRVWAKHRDRNLLSPLWSMLLLVVTLSVPYLHRNNASFDILALVLILPVAVMLGAFSQPSGTAKTIASFLGLSSYGVYILSAPLILVMYRFWQLLFRLFAGTSLPWATSILTMAVVLAAWTANSAYDVPMRRWLSRRFTA